MNIKELNERTIKKLSTLRMHKEGRKQDKDERWVNVNGVDLLVGFVPLCGPNRPLTVRCPMCGLVLLHNDVIGEYFCPECGIIETDDKTQQTRLDDFLHD